MTKIAIISDIHGNLEALKTTLEDIRKRGIKEIYCLGDIIHKGVHSKECIKIVQNNCKVVLQGNCDDYFTKEHNLELINDDIEKRRIIWNANILNEDEKNYLRNLPLCYEFYLSGRLVRLFHANPNNCYDAYGPFDSINTKYNMFLPTKNTLSQKVADFVVYGHIHYQLLNVEYNKTLINCGSVGNSLDYIRNDSKDGNVLETTNAQYLILEGELDSTEYSSINFEFIRIPYNIEKELDNDLYNPDLEAYIEELTKGKYRNIKSTYESLKKLGVDVDEI